MGKTLNVQDLSVHPKNPRKISDKRLEQLSRSMSEYGDISGIVFNCRSGNLVGGNQRSKKLDATSKVVITKRLEKTSRVGTVATGYILHQGERFSYREVDWDITKETGAMLAANNNAGQWDDAELKNHLKQLSSFDVDFDLDLTMFEDTELQEMGIKDIVVSEHLRTGPTGVDEDDVPEYSVPRSKLGDLYLLGSHRLLCGDSTDVESVSRLMNGEKADMVFTSPPYLDLRDYGGGLDLTVKKLAQIFDWPCRLFFVNLGLIVRKRTVVRYWDEWLEEAKKRDLPLLSWNVWDKGNAGSVGHQQTIFGLSHEWIFALGDYRELNKTKKNKLSGGGSWSGVSQRQKDGTLVRKDPVEVGEHRQLDTVIQLQSLRNFSEDYVGHPAAFPTALPTEYILASTKPDQMVGDPFCGSGSTLIACEKTGRKCYGMEIDPHYCDIIVERWEKYTGMKAKLLGSTVKTKKAARSVA